VGPCEARRERFQPLELRSKDAAALVVRSYEPDAFSPAISHDEYVCNDCARLRSGIPALLRRTIGGMFDLVGAERRERQATEKRIDDELEAADVTAIRGAEARTLFAIGMTDREPARRTGPRHI